ncbi:hypothetical protein I4U23_026198 [Adineta vaga]|nr:hypothetical protein I4U23_026198 [Adineta vaga]
MTVTKLFVIIISMLFVFGEQNIIPGLYYKIEGDILSFEGGGAIQYELTFTNSDMSTLKVEIESTQIIYEDVLKIDRPPHLRIYSQNFIDPAAKIIVYLRLHKPLFQITLGESATLITTNVLSTNTLSLKLLGSSSAQLAVNVDTQLHVIVLGSSSLHLSGFVKDTGYIDVYGSGHVDAQLCSMDTVIVNVVGSSSANVAARQAIDINTLGTGSVVYHGPLRKRTQNGLSWLKQLIPFFKNLFRSPFGSSHTVSKTLKILMICVFILILIIVVFLIKIVNICSKK